MQLSEPTSRSRYLLRSASTWIAIQERVVHVQQKHDLAGRAHADSSSFGLCQPPSPAMIPSASGGPHVFGSYSASGVALPRIGSITRQAASTPSSRANSETSPRIASPSNRSYGIISVAE